MKRVYETIVAVEERLVLHTSMCERARVGVGAGVGARARACVHVALFSQNGIASLAPPYFSTLSHNGTIFEKKESY
jgi:hypothetical protein